MGRREFSVGALAGLSMTAGFSTVGAGQVAQGSAAGPILRRAIPKSGEMLPMVGVGTWLTFDVGKNQNDRAQLTKVLATLFAAGGTVIDSSPMYRRAETVVGDLLAAMGGRDKAFLATKVWDRGRRRGPCPDGTILDALSHRQNRSDAGT
ncbi:MAG: aryl-alcohol dehydrogenase-like predicted oxidoreductase [Alphaproteobacteria bacterium]|jgi:aryl-alcohol dehydrogenase-like predicted oxidoreductase